MGPLPWLDEDGMRHNCLSLQLYIFHTAWEGCHGHDKAPRRGRSPRGGVQEVKSKEEALLRSPVGAKVA